jgi:hypothetical protein
MPSRTPPESAGFGGPRRSWRKASAGPAAGRGASTATARGGSGPRRTIHRLSRGHAGSAVLPERSTFAFTSAPVLRGAGAAVPEPAPPSGDDAVTAPVESGARLHGARAATMTRSSTLCLRYCLRSVGRTVVNVRVRVLPSAQCESQERWGSEVPAEMNVGFLDAGGRVLLDRDQRARAFTSSMRPPA